MWSQAIVIVEPQGQTLNLTLLPETQVKAAGGINTLDSLFEMLRADATRIGTSSTETNLEQFKAHEARWG